MLTQAERDVRHSPASRERRCSRSTAAFRRRSSVVANRRADDLRFLAAHDSDPFNRWQAVQTLANAPAGRQRGGDARGRRGPRGRRPDRGARRHPGRRTARARLRGARAHAAGRGRHRARDRPRRRSRRHLLGARRVARRDRRAARRARCSTTIAGCSDDRALPARRRERRAAGADATSASIFWSRRGGPTRSRWRRANTRSPTT